MKRKKVYSDLLYLKKYGLAMETVIALEHDNIHIIGTLTALELVEVVIQN